MDPKLTKTEIDARAAKLARRVLTTPPAPRKKKGSESRDQKPVNADKQNKTKRPDAKIGV